MDKYVLLANLAAALTAAFVFGFAAKRLKLPPLVGYLLAGVAVGPYTPGFVGDPDLALQFAEIGVILLMFGVGLKISIDDLWAVRAVAVPGALVQMGAATGLGYLVGLLLGLPAAESLVLGLSLSVASTVVLLRALEDRGLTKTEIGRVAVGWLVIEDIAIVLAIVALPALAAATAATDSGALASALALTFAKIGAFVALMLVVGTRVFPWLIVRIAHTKSRELLSLGTLALALGVAYAAFALFDASFALGAFLAGLALNSSRLAHNVAENAIPLRDTFAVLFFVSVGMLFDPSILWRDPLALLAVIAIVTIGKGAAAFAITALFRMTPAEGAFIAAALGQIGEFSFVLAALGLQLGIVSSGTHSLILAAALIAIALNPALFRIAAAFEARREAQPNRPVM